MFVIESIGQALVHHKLNVPVFWQCTERHEQLCIRRQTNVHGSRALDLRVSALRNKSHSSARSERMCMMTDVDVRI